MNTLGIDPGARTGLCLWNGEKILALITVDHAKAFDEIKDWIGKFEIRRVGVELNESTHIYIRPGTNYSQHLRIAQNVEKNRGMAREMIAYCKGLGLEVKVLKPARTKMPQGQFDALTGWEGHSSSHSRDAWLVAVRAQNNF
jgi:hypothetical protein